MLNIKLNRSINYKLILIIFISILLTACGKHEEAEPSTSEDTPQMIERKAPDRKESTAALADSTAGGQNDFRVMPKIEGSLATDGMGLETIVNASNKTAYADSLQWIAEDVSKKQFDRLESSIRYIHMYDSSVLGSESKLLSVLDGKTGNEIIEHAKTLRESRRRN